MLKFALVRKTNILPTQNPTSKLALEHFLWTTSVLSFCVCEESKGSQLKLMRVLWNINCLSVLTIISSHNGSQHAFWTFLIMCLLNIYRFPRPPHRPSEFSRSIKAEKWKPVVPAACSHPDRQSEWGTLTASGSTQYNKAHRKSHCFRFVLSEVKFLCGVPVFECSERAGLCRVCLLLVGGFL